MIVDIVHAMRDNPHFGCKFDIQKKKKKLYTYVHSRSRIFEEKNLLKPKRVMNIFN